MKGFSIRKKNCKRFFSINSNKKYLQAAIFSSPLTDMLFCRNRSRFHNKKTPDPGNKTGTRVYFPRCHPDCSEHPPNLLNSYKGLTLPTFIGSLESGTFSFLRRFAPTTGSLWEFYKNLAFLSAFGLRYFVLFDFLVYIISYYFKIASLNFFLFFVQFFHKSCLFAKIYRKC